MPGTITHQDSHNIDFAATHGPDVLLVPMLKLNIWNGVRRVFRMFLQVGP